MPVHLTIEYDTSTVVRYAGGVHERVHTRPTTMVVVVPAVVLVPAAGTCWYQYHTIPPPAGRAFFANQTTNQKAVT